MYVTDSMESVSVFFKIIFSIDGIPTYFSFFFYHFVFLFVFSIFLFITLKSFITFIKEYFFMDIYDSCENDDMIDRRYFKRYKFKCELYNDLKQTI